MAEPTASHPGATVPLALTWVQLPGGQTLIGCIAGDVACDDDEKPAKAVTIAPLWMMQTEVPVRAWQLCVEAGACSKALLDEDRPQRTCNVKNGRAHHPVNCVTQGEAQAFCAWAGGRLPSAPEWEHAARAGARDVYPWGNGRPSGTRANFCDVRCAQALSPQDLATFSARGWIAKEHDDGSAGTAAVGSYPAGANPWGLLDMAGNVREWTSTVHSGDEVDVRGGAWHDVPLALRASERWSWSPSYRFDHTGFRCVH